MGNIQTRLNKNKPKKRLKIALIILLCIFVPIGIATGYFFSKISALKTGSISKNDSDIGITNETKDSVKDKNKVKNILLTGIDHDEDATDTMIVVTIDDTKNKIKMASIFRDTYIENTPAGEVPKLNYAHKYGGIQNTVKVINENFQLDIRDYINVDINGFFRIIDKIGGVEMNVPNEDIYAINRKIDYICKKDFPNIDSTENHLTQGGKQTLNTIQAMAFVRYRTGTGDYARTDRNREFIELVMKKVSSLPKTQLISLYDSIAPFIETTLSSTEILNIALGALSYNGNGIEQAAFPYDAHTIFVNGWNYFGWDKPSNVEKIHKFIYE